MFKLTKLTAWLLVALLALSFQHVQPAAPVMASTLPVITSFSAGYDITCAVVDGAIKCWGGNVERSTGGDWFHWNTHPGGQGGFPCLRAQHRWSGLLLG